MEWERCLADAGCRITAPRRAVMQVLQQTSAPLLPQEIMELGQQVHQNLGLVTVYRTLALLTELNLVRRVHRNNGCHGYVLASPGHRHTLICQGCDQAVEFSGKDDIHALIDRVESETGYQVAGHLLQLFGLCPACQENETG
jgi:Fur family ferric uptake transcriptional regulator